MTLQFTKATRKRARARIALDGPSGSGKTYTALIAATALADGGRIAVVDTERGSASLYSDQFEFDVLELATFSPQLYIEAIEAAEKAGYSVIIVDSLSHAWEGEGGALEMVDNAAARSQSKNTYFAWRDVTPLQRKLVDAMLQSSCHIIATMRSKTEYVLEDRNGKQVPRKVGMAPIQRAGMEYEFTLVGDMDLDHRIVISKSRCAAMADKVELKPGPAFWSTFKHWLGEGDNGAAPLTAPAAGAPISAEEERYFEKPAAAQPALPKAPAGVMMSGTTQSGKHIGTHPSAAKSNGKPPSKAAVEKRWSQLWQWKLALGVEFPAISGGATLDELIEAGKKLKERLLYTAKSRLNPSVNWPDSDSTIEQAVALAKPAPGVAPKPEPKSNGKALPRQAILEHYEALEIKAAALGLRITPLADGLPTQEIINAGLALKNQVVAEARKRQAMAWAAGKTSAEPASTTDEQAIAIVIELAVQEQETAHV